MARWHERPERAELNAWARKGKKKCAETLEAAKGLYSTLRTDTDNPEPAQPQPQPQRKARKTRKPAKQPQEPKKPKKPKDPLHERYEQRVVVTHCEKRGLPFFAIPNAARRTLWEALEAKRSGMKAGVPDLCFPYPAGGYHGLWIEMKRKEGGIVSPVQHYWMHILKHYGYAMYVARGAQEAIMLIDDYFRDFKGLPDDAIQMLQKLNDSKKRRNERLLRLRNLSKTV